MAINIQEILHPSDSDSIKFEKINYNFDQILANGGGPTGPTGAKGNQGIVGLTGQKGQKGEIGNKGESGDTTSPWKSIAIDLNVNDGVDNVTILKPKPDTDKETPVIWLGDSTFINSGNSSNDGDISLRSTLNVGRHYNFDTALIEAQYVTFWHNSDNKIVIDSEDVTTGSGYVKYNLSPVDPISGTAPDIRFEIKLPTTHTGEFRLNNFNLSGDFENGMIRYNSGSENFEGYVDGAWKAFCMDPCGQGSSTTNSISIDGGDLVLQGDGQLDGSATTTSSTTTTSSSTSSSTTSSTTTTSSSTTSSTTTTTTIPVTTAGPTGIFNFTGWTSTSGETGTITSGNTDVNINSGSQTLTLNFNWDGSSISSSDFDLVPNPGWASIDGPPTFSSQTGSGSIDFTIDPNSSPNANARDFNLSVNLTTAFGGGVTAVDIIQAGTSVIEETSSEGLY